MQYKCSSSKGNSDDRRWKMHYLPRYLRKAVLWWGWCKIYTNHSKTDVICVCTRNWEDIPHFDNVDREATSSREYRSKLDELKQLLKKSSRILEKTSKTYNFGLILSLYNLHKLSERPHIYIWKVSYYIKIQTESLLIFIICINVFDELFCSFLRSIIKLYLDYWYYF